MWPSHDLPTRQAGTNDVRVSPPGIPYGLFIGFLWAEAAVAAIFLAGRLEARFRGPRRLYLDDMFILFSYALILTTVALWQWRAEDMYYVLDVNAGILPVEADFLSRMLRLLTVSLMVEIIYYTTLVLFKLSMLCFFKRLGNNVAWFNYLWCPVLLFSLSTYLVAIGNVEYRCFFGSLETLTVYCNSRSSTSFIGITLAVNCAFDVVSDFLIMLIPIILLWNVKIRWKKKIAFMGIFSLSIITIAISIARAADVWATEKSNGMPDGTYLWFWSALQSCLCVVVACSSAFRQLFIASTRSNNNPPVWRPTASFYERMKSSFRQRPRRQDDITLYDISAIEAFDYVTVPERSKLASNHSIENPTPVPDSSGPAWL